MYILLIVVICIFFSILIKAYFYDRQIISNNWENGFLNFKASRFVLLNFAILLVFFIIFDVTLNVT